METFVARLETASRLLHGVGDRATRLVEIAHEVHILADDLRKVGPLLETSYPDVLDRVMSSMRDASAQPSLPASLRLAIFELVELRAAKWTLPSDTSNYYRQRRTLSEAGEENTDAIEAANSNAAIELTNQTFRQDVLIKNSDSGKVAPTAKERVLSINGYSQQSIGMAKHLIQETIERNASPVFDDQQLTDQDCEAEPDANPTYVNALQNFAPIPPQLDEMSQYNYSVTIGNEVIKISGKHLNLVQEAKLALDDYFYRKYPDALCLPVDESVNPSRQRAGPAMTNANSSSCQFNLFPNTNLTYIPPPVRSYDRRMLLSLGLLETPPPDFSHLDPTLRESIVLKKRRPLDPEVLPRYTRSDTTDNQI
jgi:hypothetical protein